MAFKKNIGNSLVKWAEFVAHIKDKRLHPPPSEGTLPSGTENQTLRHDGSGWEANDILKTTVDGIDVQSSSGDTQNNIIDENGTYNAIIHKKVAGQEFLIENEVETPSVSAQKFLIHCNSDFSDSSPQNHTPTVTNATIVTTTKKLGAGSGYFQNSTDPNPMYYVSYLDTGNDTDFGTDDFTITFWANMYSHSYPDTFFLTAGGQVAGTVSWCIKIYLSNTLVFESRNGKGKFSCPFTPVYNVWSHYAFVVKDQVPTIYINGIAQVTTVNTALGNIEGGNLVLGAGSYDLIGYQYYGLRGYLDEVMILKGEALYTENFTPPVLEYISDTGVWTDDDIILAKRSTQPLEYSQDIIYGSEGMRHIFLGTLDWSYASSSVILPTSLGGTGKDTWTANGILYASSASVLSQIAVANSSILVTNGSGVPSLSTTLPQHTVTTQVTVPKVEGSTSASGTLTLSSTSNATKGKIILGTASAYDQANDRLGIGNTSPSYKIDISYGSNANVVQLTGAYNGASNFVFKNTTNTGLPRLYLQNDTAGIFAIQYIGSLFSNATIRNHAEIGRTSAGHLNIFFDVEAGSYFNIRGASRVIKAQYDIANNYLSLPQIRAIDSNGLKIYESGGKGIFVQHSTGYTGILTETPRRALDILDASNPQLRISQADNSKYVDLRADSNSYLNISCGGTDAIQVRPNAIYAPNANGLLLYESGGTGIKIHNAGGVSMFSSTDPGTGHLLVNTGLAVNNKWSSISRVNFYAENTNDTINLQGNRIIHYTTDNITKYVTSFYADAIPIISTGKKNSGYVRTFRTQALRTEAGDEGELASLDGFTITIGHYTTVGATAKTNVVTGFTYTPYAQKGTIDALYGLYGDELVTGGTCTVGYNLYLLERTFKNFIGGSTCISIAKTSNAPTTISNSNSYLRLGFSEYGNNSYRAIGFGYSTDALTYQPAYITYKETSITGNTKGQLEFRTRDVTTDTEPSVRMSIETDGTVAIEGTLQHKGSNLGFFNATPVTRASAYTITNVTTDRTFNADSTTLDEIADVLGTLIADLKSYGLLQ